MTLIATFAAVICGTLTVIQFGSLGLALWRLRRPLKKKEAGREYPFIALTRPLCGQDSFEEETLRSSFQQDYPNYEILFCVASADDPVIPLVEKVIASYPERPARLLIGEDKISGNPKINNLNKAWHATRSDWVVMADSNLLLPADYLLSLMDTFDDQTGLVSSPAFGIRPENLWGAVEAAMFNTHQARWQFLSDFAGMGFAQGKTLFWRRAVLENGGGLSALGAELAEDVASTKLVRNAGLKVRLPPRPFPLPIGRRSLSAVWSRQLRWARIRRFGFLWLFIPEILLGSLPPLAAAVYLAAIDVFPWAIPPALMAMWYAAEWGLAKAAGWPHHPRDVLAMAIRDILFPALWLWCWTGRSFVWRGNILDAKPSPSGNRQPGK
ncbi:glycosyltransferase [Brenneria izadpanahii]|uniref:Glycosyltransferase n=1 Tax=Brenneria izadpanahii TaxID=2722756 RepID=A0ABX7USS3_9GAMM|nr:ceramide glucosyltransferase [Brenneria izadpanahii]QTF08726.1 glycosyltransferase [Brenneria izadpanahii]